MCTVTFIPLRDKVFLTHNRDESSVRAKATAPQEYNVNGHTLLFPRDAAAGGTWIAVNKNGAAAVLLNGAFRKHQPQPPYNRSRGLVFLDIIASDNVLSAYQLLNLQAIEPFTVILWQHGLLYECRWDGTKKHISMPAATEAHTWSSVTLYDSTVLAKREQWFASWQQTLPKEPAMRDIIRYHLTGGEGDPQNDLQMNRQGAMLTVSITSIQLQADSATMQYIQLPEHQRSEHAFTFTKARALPQ
ncbi:MAG TPA: NRDE family protein [Chitinophagaceae bacterium]|nr:NRDE family protein [Chitinophagaceae bacterium]